MFAAACGDSDADAESSDVASASNSTQGGDGGDDGSSGDGGSDGGTDGSDDGTGATDSDGVEPDADESPDNDDAAEIVGQTTLPEDVEEMLDDIDDVVSIGDCQSDVVGLAMEAPDGWVRRVLDNSIGGLDGFTLFTDGNQLNITIGTPSDLPSPCEVLLACDDATPVSLSDNFPDTMQVELVGTVTIWGTYKDSDAELVITSLEPLTPEDVQFISDVLDSVMPLS